MKTITKTSIFAGLMLVFSVGLYAQGWEEKAGLPGTDNGRHHPVTWSIGEYGYLLTGSTNAEENGTVDFFRYDPSDDSWDQLDDFPGLARSYAVGAVYDGKGYIGFGNSDGAGYLNDLWRYDPVKDEWEQLADCSCSGREAPAFTVNEEQGPSAMIYAGLGYDGSNLSDWWRYSVEDDQWIQRAGFGGLARNHTPNFTIGEYSYVGMGHGTSFFTSWYQYDALANSWAQMENTPGPRVAGTYFTYNGYGFVLSGNGNNNQSTNPSVFWYYDPDMDEWDELEPHPGDSRWAPGSFVIDGIVYFVAGGEFGESTYYDDMWAYDLKPGFGDPINVDNPGEIPFSIYPNPASDYLYIQLPEPVDGVRAKIYGMDGRLLSENPVEDKIEVRSLTPGVYIMELENGPGQTGFSRFVKK